MSPRLLHSEVIFARPLPRVFILPSTVGQPPPPQPPPVNEEYERSQALAEAADEALELDSDHATATLKAIVLETPPSPLYVHYHDAYLRRLRRAVQVGVSGSPACTACGCTSHGPLYDGGCLPLPTPKHTPLKHRPTNMRCAHLPCPSPCFLRCPRSSHPLAAWTATYGVLLC